MTAHTLMQIGLVGLGRMGANLVRRLMRDGHSCVVYDIDTDAVASLSTDGATAATSVTDLIEQLAPPRAVWVMVPAGDVTGKTIDDLVGHMGAGDAIIDGGNSYYRDDMRRANELSKRGINLIDCGTSSGVWGVDRELMESGRRVAMVGDGINDAPAQPDLGIPLGARTDLGVETAGAVRMRSDPLEVAAAVCIGRDTVRLDRHNLGWTLGDNTLALPMAAAGLRPRLAAIATPRDRGDHNGRIECPRRDQRADPHVAHSAPTRPTRTSR